jgi:hypothetical protein
MSSKCKKQSDLEKFMAYNKDHVNTVLVNDILNEKEGWGAQMEWSIGWRGGRMFDANVNARIALNPYEKNLPVERQKIEESIVRYIYKKADKMGVKTTEIEREFEYASDESENENSLLYSWINIGVGLGETEVL